MSSASDARLFASIATVCAADDMALHGRVLILAPSKMATTLRQLRQHNPETAAWAVSRIVEERFLALQRRHRWRVRVARREMNSVLLAKRW